MNVLLQNIKKWDDVELYTDESLTRYVWQWLGCYYTLEDIQNFNKEEFLSYVLPFNYCPFCGKEVTFDIKQWLDNCLEEFKMRDTCVKNKEEYYK